MQRHTLQSVSPGGSVRTHEYETVITPPGETADARARRKTANRNRLLRARKALAKLVEAPPAVSTPLPAELPDAPAPSPATLPAASAPRKRRTRLPGIRSESKLDKLSLMDQASALMEAEAEDYDVDNGEAFGSGGWYDDCFDAECERRQREAEQQLEQRAADADRQLRSRSAHGQRGHGHERLSQLEDLLSHDAWEPVNRRALLWRELHLLLESDPFLRSHLVVPADIETSTEYSEPVPCVLCCSKLRDGAYDYVSGEWWCERCTARVRRRSESGGSIGTQRGRGARSMSDGCARRPAAIATTRATCASWARPCSGMIPCVGHHCRSRRR